MVSLLLVIIYISFISLGLPDSLLGSAWPAMHGELGVPVAYAGIISMIIAGGTIISSFNSDRLIKKLGTGKITAVSVGMTAAALFGFSVSNSFVAICLWAIPYGLGAGSVDAALNNFVALHYESKHMSWLHCFWGVGATLGPYIMGMCLTAGLKWNSGYRAIGIIQVLLTAVLIVTLPLWKKSSSEAEKNEEKEKNFGIGQLLKLTGAKPVLVSFFCYCSLESTTGLWGSSYLVINRGISAETAAKWISLFYLGITAGRFLSGFITMKLSDKNMVRVGQAIIILGIAALLLPGGNIILCIGFVLVGMGCAPIYPSLLHETPDNFGKEISQAIMGIQMACAYLGSTFMPPLFGLIAQNISIRIFPIFLLALVILMIFMVEQLNHSNRQAIKF